jgi:hypothetical protein
MTVDKKYIPDVKAPRFRSNTTYTVTLETATQIKKEVFACRSMSLEQIKSILMEYNKEIVDTVINKRDGVEIPMQIGHMFVGTCPMTKRKNVNFKMSQEYMQTIQHRNWESDNYLAKIFFTTFGNKFRYKNNELWGFEPHRDFKRTLSKVYPVKWKQYVEVDPQLKISNIYRTKLYNIKKSEEDAESLKSYNEFEF